ncbi:Site-specific recombinase XerD [Nitrosomonas ureae]|uniref:Site-specific recombinase XerD n=1 Tax=Nitrosomonas ureae TaxID=44577 RepID=A0A285BVG2_9PROT|nr:integrase family protein [Nitrosomonas ureae]SNX59274.1 Site-specific recombinase XerD [Nitrosomonas ureae]
MKWDNFTSERVASFKCKPGAKQSIFWDGKQSGLGLRVTASGTKSYIFQTELHGKTMRITIGNYPAWSISDAQTEAARLKVKTDQGIDPRQEAAEEKAAKQASEAARKAQEAREIVTVGQAWEEYVTARKPLWSELHIRDHDKVMQAGGDARKRSKKLTEPGSLATLAKIRLVDLTPELVTEWAQTEAMTRPTRARLALRLLRAFLNWCGRHSTYKAIVTSNPAQNNDARESLGKAKVKHDVLQREQLLAWFKAIKQIQNPIISAYLQTLLLTGARREEIASLRWQDIDFQWNSLTINDKVEDFRVIPLTPYVANLLSALTRRNEWVFSSPTAASGRLTDPSIAHRKACAIAGLDLTLHGLRRSFASLCEWIEMPAGIAAQIQGHKPQGVREQNYIRRPLDLLRMWHVKIESWILKEAGINFIPTQAGLCVVKK